MQIENFEVYLSCHECGSAFITDCPLDILCDHCVDIAMNKPVDNPLQYANVINYMADMIEKGEWLGNRNITRDDCSLAAERIYLSQMAVLL